VPRTEPNIFDVTVIGGGLVGTALAYGLARKGLRVAVLDEGDVALRASRGNPYLRHLVGGPGGRASRGHGPRCGT
jgi:glycine/D-amino acid oxidase-like deaminating enzyme